MRVRARYASREDRSRRVDASDAAAAVVAIDTRGSMSFSDSPPKRARPAPPSTIGLKIRTITAGITLSRDESADVRSVTIEQAAIFLQAASKDFTSAGYEVQTTRIATNSFEEWCDVSDSAATLEAFRTLDSLLVELGVGLFNAGPATSAAALSLVPKIVQLGGRINCTGALTDPLDANGALALAATILEISQSTDGGEGNVRAARTRALVFAAAAAC